jgi:two-component system cell cycle sensor histidine kinase/response regulator CckA
MTHCILLAEDAHNIRFFMSSVLRQKGYEVIEAVDGIDALQKFQQNPGIEMVITDLVMPRWSGYELAEAIRKLRPEVPIVAITAYMDLCYELPDGHVDLCLQKPIGRDQFLAAIRSITAKL